MIDLIKLRVYSDQSILLLKFRGCVINNYNTSVGCKADNCRQKSILFFENIQNFNLLA